MEKKGVWRESLQMQTNKILYVRGNSSSVPFINLYHAILERRRKNTYAAVGIWTIDKYSSMKRYLEAGVDLILTNMPSLLAVDLIGHNLSLHHIYARKCFYCQITYSESGGRFFLGGGGELYCSYYRFLAGGCAITKVPPPNQPVLCGNWKIIIPVNSLVY